MMPSAFAYVTYIRAAPEAVWSALTDPEAMARYWFGVRCESRWAAGSPWKLVYPGGRATDEGEIAASDPPRRLAIRWRHRDRPEFAAEGESLCLMELSELAPAGAATRLSLAHTLAREGSEFIAAVSVAWPMVLSNLKSLLETGSVVLQEPAN